jgi:hypothetical protein
MIFADGVVGQISVEAIDELGGGVVADPVSGIHSSRAQREQ